MLATALVIIAGTGDPARRLAPLTNKPMRYIGDISFSLYLWHFPVVVLLAALMPQRGGLFYVLAVSVTTVFSVLSYHFVEQQVLRSTWLNADRGGKQPQSTHPPEAPGRRGLRLGVAAAVTVGVVALGSTFVVATGVTGSPKSSLSPGALPAPGPAEWTRPNSRRGSTKRWAAATGQP